MSTRALRRGRFNQFRTHDFDEPANLYYEVRI